MNQLTTFFKNFWNDEEGLETVEILLILSVLIVIAIMFRDRIGIWVNALFEDIDDQLMN
ncbi:Flp pilus assembly pilin Flp [Virgibacillus natechei]|uniref:Flp pilus assembly pilin Flp n=1 Tax=Virgibacillus natechei TaxID=1216297 RepID=A0ABS4ICG9_9BACI|nr:Flp1 family type IVb pilin [Virgibacillus natechei]MBP1968641.1 Flp pilus assembly pilin Flp [Virgibacillus natechei]UZD13746.1 Flp1 family type IVb pilin [Virgibacillus natechei]